MNDLVFTRAAACLALTEPAEKLPAVDTLLDAWRSEGLLDDSGGAPATVPSPGLPKCLKLVPPRDVPRRRMASRRGRIALFHAVAHIEYTAINLALDAVARFPQMPREFRDDWLRIAAEEVDHFRRVRALLNALDVDYGDLPAHQGIWDMATKTEGDPMLRMALVPRVLEAHGLDVTAPMIARLDDLGDRPAVEALGVIYAEEVGHVKAGTRWFRQQCDERGLDADTTFLGLMREHLALPLKGKLNRDARIKAGFSEREMAELVA